MKLKDILEGDVVQFPGSQKPVPARKSEIIPNDKFFPKYWKQYTNMIDDLMRQPVVVNGKHISFKQWYDTYIKTIPAEERYQYVQGRLVGDIQAQIETGDEKSTHPGGSSQHLEFLREITDNIHIHRKIIQINSWHNKLDNYIELLWDKNSPAPADTFSEFIAFGGVDQQGDQPSFVSKKEVRRYGEINLVLSNLYFFMTNDYKKKKR